MDIRLMIVIFAIIISGMIYFIFYQGKRKYRLDRYGVLGGDFINYFSFIEINKDDFLWVKDMYLKQFPEGSIELNILKNNNINTSNILVISSTFYSNPEKGIKILETKFYLEKNIGNLYALYLTSPCFLNNSYSYFLKGSFYQGDIDKIKYAYERWLKEQNRFILNYSYFVDKFRNIC